VRLLSVDETLSGGGRLTGVTTVSFSIALPSSLPDTYHGRWLLVQYLVKCTVQRGLTTTGNAVGELEFYVESRASPVDEGAATAFTLTDDGATSTRVSGRLDSCVVRLDARAVHHGGHVTGELNVHEGRVEQVLLRIVRLEQAGVLQTRGTLVLDGTPPTCDERLTERSCMQQTVIADGRVCRGLGLPLLATLPPHASCPSIVTPSFSIQFAVELELTLLDRQTLTHSIPVTLVR